MSLFKCREWWRVNCGTSEEFDRGCLCIANIDNDPSREAKIVTGSFQGILRIYQPRDRDFRVEDLLLEQNLNEPILQVEAGGFTSSGGVSLAVLHPRRLCVYGVTAVGNQEQASYFSLQKAYEHTFERTAFNLVYGPFGGVNGHDYICVQSMDGQLCVYEHETLAFSRFLHNFLVPGPLLYLQKTDSFITCNASYEVECYKYTVLAASSAERQSVGGLDEGSGLTLTKKVQVDWSVNIGEPALEIHAARFTRALTSAQVDVLVLGERHVFALSEMGTVRTQMRLDYSPMAMLPYRAGSDDLGGPNQNAIVATHTGSLMLYKDTQLVWAAKCDSVPVAMGVAKFGALEGLTVLLDEGGQLTVNYLGTDPPMNVVGGGEGKELNYEEMDEEHRRLLTIIREATSDVKAEPTERVSLRAQVPTRLDAVPGSPEEGGGRASKQQRSVTVRLFVSFTGSGSLENVHITLKLPRPFTCSQDSLVLPQLTGGQRTPVIIPITIYSGIDSLPADNTVTVTAAYTTDLGEPRTAHCEMQIPLCLACQVVAPVKNAGYKITLDTTRMPPQLTALFEDVVMQSPHAGDLMARSSSANVLTFQYYSGHDVTILVSKTGGRYRLQAGTFEAIWLVAKELCQRLNTYFAGAADRGGGEEPFAITFQEPLPLQDFFQLIDNHFEARERFSGLTAQLAQRAHQFRSIQKRLLIRFKDRNPAPLSHLDTLLEGTFQQLSDLGAQVEECQEELREHATLLSCGCQVIVMLIRYRFSMDDASFEVLSSYLSPEVETGGDQGWEECTDASMTHLLRTSLAKNAKEQTAVPQPLAPLKDTSKLKKHISIVCERLARGAKLKLEE